MREFSSSLARPVRVGIEASLEGSPFNWREQRSGRLITPVMVFRPSLPRKVPIWSRLIFGELQQFRQAQIRRADTHQIQIDAEAPV